MITPLGKALRKLRIDRGWLLKDMADGIGVASSFASGIETGRKAIPSNYVDRVIKWGKLTKEEAAELKNAEIVSRTKFKIQVGPNFTAVDHQAAALLARFGELPLKDRDEIRKILARRFD